MALFIESKANVFQVALKKGVSGKDYATCNLVFYSKSKDEKGEYTKEDPKFQVRAVAFGSNAEYLKSLPGGKGFVDVMGKLSNGKVEKDGQVKYFDRFDIIKVSGASTASAKEVPDAEIINDEDVPF